METVPPSRTMVADDSDCGDMVQTNSSPGRAVALGTRNPPRLPGFCVVWWT